MLTYTIKLDYKMPKCHKDEDGDIDTKPDFDPSELTTNSLQAFYLTSLKLQFSKE